MALFGKPRERDVVTLAIESTDLRYLSTKGGRVDKWGSVPLPEGLVSGGMITNAVEMGSILDEMVEACGLDRKHVITSLSGLRSIPRLLILPRLQGSVLEETISREARKEMPVSLEDLYLSWYSMPGGGEQQQIYLLGVPRELIDAQVRALEAAGIRHQVQVVVGGAPVTQRFADRIGADGYGADGGAAIELCRRLVGK